MIERVQLLKLKAEHATPEGRTDVVEHALTVLAGLPGVLRSFTDTFVEGRAAVLPLVTAAPQVANIAPQLDQLLKAVAPFTAAAVPTLNRAASVAPTLTELAAKATPTVQQAVPTLASLSPASAEAPVRLIAEVGISDDRTWRTTSPAASEA